MGRIYRILESELEAALQGSAHVPFTSEDLIRERHEDDARDERKLLYRTWHSLSLEEKKKRLQAGRGAYARVPFSSDDLVRERREEAERQERRLTEERPER